MTRFIALVKKETLQLMRDPSALIITFVLPPILLFLFAFAVSLDVRNVPIGVVLEGDGPQAQSLAGAYAGTPFLKVTPARHRKEVEQHVVSGTLKGFVVIPADFDERLLNPDSGAAIQIITDGSSPNTANFVAGYAQGVFNNWLAGRNGSGRARGPVIDLQQRFWFNPELESRRVLVPGAIAIVMTLIGTLLTALVVAREWERGTMEALMSTPASMLEIILSKLLPYFLLGITAVIGCVFLAHKVFGLPLRGSPLTLLLVSCVFLVPALGQGLLISTLSKNQFIASQIALMSAYLPALLLSGFIFEIDSMPPIIQTITRVIPARYYVSSLQTVFLAGDIWPVLIPNMLAMLAVGALFFAITFANSRKRLD
ncbi:MAG: ABC transporter permease [Gammaproteobacteria bacterium]|nr:ABC transporter permease [Gammaproteobacteria bacterium]